MMFFGLDSTDINYRILEYTQWFDMFVAYHFKNISTGNFSTYLDTFKVDVQNAYKDVNDEYFITYVRYNIAEMEQVFGAGKNSNSKLETYLNYIEPFPIYYENDQYMKFIKRFYTQDFEDYIPDVEMSINLAIHYSSPTNLMQALRKDLFLARPDIREMVMIDKLGKAFYKYIDSKQNILTILDSVQNHAKYPVHATIAKNVKSYLTKLEYGFPAPHISLRDSADNEVTWAKYKGKYVYFNFFATWNEQSLTDMRVIRDLRKKYNDDITFLSVCVDKDREQYEKFLKDNPDMDWDIIYVGEDEKLMNAYDAKTVPAYYLIDHEGFIIYAPAPGPSPDGEYDSIEITFFEIYSYYHPNNERRLEKP